MSGICRTGREARAHIVIMGRGRVGSMLAQGLKKRDHSVAVIDVNVNSFWRFGIGFQGATVSRAGLDREVLETIDVRYADGFAAAPSGDDSSILAVRVVRGRYGVDNAMVRIYDQGKTVVYERLDISAVATVRWTVGQVMRRLLPESSELVWRNPSGIVWLLQVYIHSAWVGKRIRDLSVATQAPIPFVPRTGRGIVPDFQTVFQDEDPVFVAYETERTDNAESLFTAPPARSRDL